MTERDPLGEVLREWQSVEPSPEFDERVLLACRQGGGQPWHRIWRMRVSLPVPVLVFAAMVMFAIAFWLGSSRPQPPSTAAGVVTQIDGSGFQPLPDGEARVISVKDLKK